MEIQKASLILKDLPQLDAKSLIIGEKVNAHVLKNLGNGFYIIQLKNSKVKVKSQIPLYKHETFLVAEKIGNQIVLKPEVSAKSFQISKLISGLPSLKSVDDPLLQYIVYQFLKKNLQLDEEKILKIYNLLKNFKDVNLLKNGIICFIINLTEQGIVVNSQIVEKLVDYVKFLNERKDSGKKKDKNGKSSDNKRGEKLFSGDFDKLGGFLKDISSLIKDGENKGSFYFLFPFKIEEENFYSEIKFYFDKNDLGERDYGFSASLHLNTGEIRINGNYIRNYIYIKIYFENTDFLDFAKKEIQINNEAVKSIDFFPLAELEDFEEILFSDLHIKDEKIDFNEHFYG